MRRSATASSGVRLSYVTEPERRGTAGAIRFAAETLGDRLEQRFLALNGDVLTDLDLTALLRTHEEHARAGDAGPVPGRGRLGIRARPPRRGGRRARVPREDRRARPRRDQRRRLRARSLGARPRIPPGARSRSSERCFRDWSATGSTGCRSTVTGWTSGPPTVTCRRAGTSSRGGSTPPSRPTAPGMLVGADVEIGAGAVVGPRAVVAPGCRIGAGAEVRGSVLLDGCSIGEGARIDGSILAPGVSVAAGATLADVVAGRDERVPA